MKWILLAIATLLLMSSPPLFAVGPGDAANTSQSLVPAQIGALIDSELLKSAQRGDAGAQYRVGYWFWTKPSRSAEETQQAAEWFRRSAQQGNQASSFRLAYMMATGLGVPRDEEKAATLLASTAKAGYLPGQRIYGMYLEAGLGVKQNPEEALYWYDRAAEKGDEESRDLALKLRSRLVAENRGDSPFPSVPDAILGRVTCNTRCINGNCYRTYDDGKQVRFQARQDWDPMQNTFVWDSGGC